jgi:hypothetical protein
MVTEVGVYEAHFRKGVLTEVCVSVSSQMDDQTALKDNYRALVLVVEETTLNEPCYC